MTFQNLYCCHKPKSPGSPKSDVPCPATQTNKKKGTVSERRPATVCVCVVTVEAALNRAVTACSGKDEAVMGVGAFALTDHMSEDDISTTSQTHTHQNPQRGHEVVTLLTQGDELIKATKP